MILALLAAAWLAVTAQAGDPLLCVPSLPESKLLHKVEPVYPAAALERRIQGAVRVNVVIGKDGRVESVRLISGHPLLVKAAMEAVRQWIYRPAMLNGKPVRVATQVQVRFQLDARGKPPGPRRRATARAGAQST